MSKNYCKTCFRAVVDGTAHDNYLWMTGEPMKCPLCEQVKPLVGYYFKYGERRVKDDGKHLVGQSKHVGVNPNYTFFAPCSPYPED